jgi:hypothetical protein
MEGFPSDWYRSLEMPPHVVNLVSHALGDARQHRHTITDDWLATREPTIIHERSARHALYTDTRRTLGVLCPTHSEQLSQKFGDDSQQTLPIPSITQRNLMPLGPLCTSKHLASLHRDPTILAAPFDTCVCSSRILHSETLRGPQDCSGCAMAQNNFRKRAYLTRTQREDHSRMICGCECEEVLTGASEVMRICACCEGLVSVPLHALDNVTHLAAPAGAPSCEYGSVSTMQQDESILCEAEHPICREFLMPTPGFEVVQLGGEIGDEEQAAQEIFRAGASWLRRLATNHRGLPEAGASELEDATRWNFDQVQDRVPPVDQEVGHNHRRDSVATWMADLAPSNDTQLWSPSTSFAAHEGQDDFAASFGAITTPIYRPDLPRFPSFDLIGHQYD